jgi:hypothetical protein
MKAQLKRNKSNNQMIKFSLILADIRSKLVSHRKPISQRPSRKKKSTIGSSPAMLSIECGENV